MIFTKINNIKQTKGFISYLVLQLMSPSASALLFSAVFFSVLLSFKSFRSYPNPYALQIVISLRSKSPLLYSQLRSKNEPQLLSFIEPTTGIAVKLVGAMHYNPTSTRLAVETVEKSARQRILKAVLVESCPTRWNKMIERDRKLSANVFMRNIFTNEMQSASFAASKYNVPTILADQDINITNVKMVNSLKDTFISILLPFRGKWTTLIQEYFENTALSLPSGPEYLSLKDFLDPKLILTTPVSLVRYTLAIAYKQPFLGLLLFVMIFGSELQNSVFSSFTSTSIEVSETMLDRIQDLLVSVSISGLEVLFLSRVFLTVLLTERNKVIADTIRNTCQLIVSTSGEPVSSEYEIIAVVGMAHCNGIKKYLLDRLPPLSTIDNYEQSSTKFKNLEELKKKIVPLVVNFPLIP